MITLLPHLPPPPPSTPPPQRPRPTTTCPRPTTTWWTSTLDLAWPSAPACLSAPPSSSRRKRWSNWPTPPSTATRGHRRGAMAIWRNGYGKKNYIILEIKNRFFPLNRLLFIKFETLLMTTSQVDGGDNDGHWWGVQFCGICIRSGQFGDTDGRIGMPS